MPSLDEMLHKDHPHHWLEAEAEVTDCTFVRYDPYRKTPSVRGGFDVGQIAHYTVGFSYKVNGATYPGVLSSPVHVELRDKFLIRYNPNHPEQNNSLESRLNRPWYRGYAYVLLALLLVLLLVDSFRHHGFLR